MKDSRVNALGAALRCQDPIGESSLFSCFFNVKTADLWAQFSIVSLWISIIFLVNPVGNFPITDDWAFAQSVKTLVTSGRLEFSGWGAMNLISQVGWGALFSAVFGFSYTTLRLSTLVLAVGGALALYRICRLGGVSIGVALLATAVGTLNPLYLFLAFSFMTDVPYTAIQLAAIALILGQKRVVRLSGWAMGVMALMCRQTGLAIPMAWGGAIVREVFSLRRIALAGASILSFILIQFAYGEWLRMTGLAPAAYGNQIHSMMHKLASSPGDALLSAFSYTLYATHYVGLFILPITIPLTLKYLQNMNSGRIFTSTAWLLIASSCMYLFLVNTGHYFPMFNDTITYGGIGTEYQGKMPPGAYSNALMFSSVVGALLFFGVSRAVAVTVFQKPGSRVRDVVLYLSLVLFAPLPFVEPHLDRYLVPILPCIAAAVTSTFLDVRIDGWRFATGAACAAVITLVSVAATHDFLAWKRVQRLAYEKALTLAPANQIDGNWVLNGERLSPAFFGSRPAGSWRFEADYVVDSCHRANYVVVKKYSVKQWLARGNFVLLQRNTNKDKNFSHGSVVKFVNVPCQRDVVDVGKAPKGSQL